MPNPHLERARLLMRQSRPELAEKELRQALSEDIRSAEGHALLSLCLASLDRLEEATHEAEESVRSAPDQEMGHYAMANALNLRKRYREALESIAQSIRLRPGDANNFAMLASVHSNLGNWRDALGAAEKGLQFDAFHVGCSNLRAMALVHLGRRLEADQTLGSVLAKDPENAGSHMSQGWVMLHRNDPKAALVHFREALRIDPELHGARQGIVEALKARNPIYRIMLAYFLWMARLNPGVRTAIIIGGYFGAQALHSVGETMPAIKPIALPLFVLYCIFAVMTWISVPLFNLLLRLNRFGRYALSRDQKMGSNLFGLCLLAALASLVTYFVYHSEAGFIGAILIGLLAIPTSAIFGCSKGWPRWAMGGVTLLLAGLCGVILVTLARCEHVDQSPPEWMQNAINAYAISIFISQWVAMSLARVVVRR